ncbi:MAG: ribose-phosphate pyrophosphokinase [Candidatus Omnitrophica bacterium]|nr:ribose-phosphate pyrophosphokinase [Candidatus Omnitrophota bacterium]MBU2043977.1 ribose-phosphate pyrophosphokinase [Candidatus Omnitrophota bacterium]MBU2250787.1 ribose-phosphate pyrophosphokinase [Candidatus Omnitrophota bacterium]MBU2266108.1 ribose-phosphate pyrophosphokinase [Candidatus Omnitrophota bacterium]MBU2473416.1 ribose-phosphate pyrophosphokinase [Candidatus Omnitrophota bacterium]
MDKMVIFSGSANKKLAEKICKNLKVKLGQAFISHFSDGEIRVEIGENVRGKDVFVIQPTCPPVNENLMELLIMLDALRRASAQRITAVIPYFGYARQDRKDQPRVPITAKLVANVLDEAGADRILTLDLHAGQIQGFFDIPLDHLYATNVFVDSFRRMRFNNMVIASPDVGGIKTARAYAKRFRAGLAIVDKRRNSPEATEVMHILGEVDGKNVILVDDIIATGSSIVEAARALKKAGAEKIFAAITHGILSADAVSKINKSCIDTLVITDSIPLADSKKSKKIKVASVSSLFADAIKRIHFEESISVLFNSLEKG